MANFPVTGHEILVCNSPQGNLTARDVANLGGPTGPTGPSGNPGLSITGPTGPTGAAGLGVLSATVTLTSGQILACDSTPVQIIPAPGAGKVINLLSTTYSTTADVSYTGGTGSGLFIAASGQAIDTGDQGILLGTSLGSDGVTFARNKAELIGGNFQKGVINNQPFTYSASIPFADGTGTLKITAVYTVVTL